ncbi:hypothetical protein EDB85DRAFT_1903665 [Lactarius pseudohatsudake]|nr:hypothetical protein EDB85DRAFT_1903665 [Lactarius pseudohatsudake]
MSMLQIGVTSRIMTTAIIKATTTTTTMDDYDEVMAMAMAMATGAATTATVTAMVMGRAQGDDDSDYESTSTPQQPQGGDDNSSTTSASSILDCTQGYAGSMGTRQTRDLLHLSPDIWQKVKDLETTLTSGILEPVWELTGKYLPVLPGQKWTIHGNCGPDGVRKDFGAGGHLVTTLRPACPWASPTEMEVRNGGQTESASPPGAKRNIT